MTTNRYDVVVVGGGVGGAAVAYRLAVAGFDVLVLEQTRTYRDRVRGDVMYPWGVTAAVELGLLETMLAGPARRLPYWRTRFAGFPAPPPRVLAEEVGESAAAFFHPELQTALVAAAELAGARVLRGARALGVSRGPNGPRITYRQQGAQHEVSAALVVGADGRNSAVGGWAGFERRRHTPRLVFAGVLMEGVSVEPTNAPADTNQLYFHPSEGLLAMTLPVDEHRTRLYAGYHLAGGRRPEVGTDMAAFLSLARAAGVPAGVLEGATQAGPLAAFDGAEDWAVSAYEDGVALVGDAAATSDPSFGCGMALTMLSAQLLTSALTSHSALDPHSVAAAGAAYDAAMREAYGSLRRQVDWLTSFYRTPGAAADAWRARRYPLHAAEPWRVPDVVGVGPAGPSDGAARVAFLGVDSPVGT